MKTTNVTTHNASPPPYVWRWLGVGAVLLMAGSVLLITLISAGVFDPQPIGEESGQWTLETVALAPGERELIWLEEPRLPPSYTVRLLASFAEGSPDVGYGLALGQDDAFLAAAVSPTGYATVWREVSGSEREEILPWQTWPHVDTGSGSNEIQIDVTADHVTIRINRELLWQGQVDIAGDRVALYGESFAAAASAKEASTGGASIQFQELRLFIPENQP
jgi:hypothetical protein